MPDLPSPDQIPQSPTPSPTVPVAEPTPTVPHVVTRKRTLMIISIIISIVVVLLILAGVALFLLWRSNTPPATTSAPLPAVSTTPAPSVAPSETTTPTPTNSLSSDLSNRIKQLAQQQNNLSVTVQYTGQPQFSLKVTDVQRTYQVDTSDMYAPITGTPYSVLKVYDAAGQVLAEKPFTVTTGVIAEGAGVTGGTSDVPTSLAILQVALPLNAVPQKIEIQGSGGQVFDSQTIAFDQLPLVVPLDTSTQVAP